MLYLWLNTTPSKLGLVCGLQYWGDVAIASIFVKKKLIVHFFRGSCNRTEQGWWPAWSCEGVWRGGKYNSNKNKTMNLDHYCMEVVVPVQNNWFLISFQEKGGESMRFLSSLRSKRRKIKF